MPPVQTAAAPVLIPFPKMTSFFVETHNTGAPQPPGTNLPEQPSSVSRPCRVQAADELASQRACGP